MTTFRKELTDLIRPHLVGSKFPAALVAGIDGVLDRAGVPRDGAPPAKPPAPTPAPTPATAAAPAPPAPAVPASRLTVAGLRTFLGFPAAGSFDETARQALFARLSNLNAPALTDADFDRTAEDLGVSPKLIRAVRKVEAPRGPFDDDGRPAILYERHVFARNTSPKARFNLTNRPLSGPAFRPGEYGSFSAQWEKLAGACALDPEAAFEACSWGAFQVLGENAVSLGYGSALEMALALTVSEAAHLDSFVRFVRANKLVDELRACRAGDPASCISFVSIYNGAGFRTFKYHIKLAKAAL